MLFRVYIPASMLWLTSFRTFICFLFPVLCISQVIIVRLNNELTQKKLEQFGLEDEVIFQQTNNIMRDLNLFIYCAWGLYCYSSTLVNRFITYETSRLQQSYMTKLFHEQRDGLVVLKPRSKRDGDVD